VKLNITSSAAVLLFVFGAGDVLAQGACTAGLTAAQLVTTLSGKYICAKRPGPVRSGSGALGSCARYGSASEYAPRPCVAAYSTCASCASVSP